MDPKHQWKHEMSRTCSVINTLCSQPEPGMNPVTVEITEVITDVFSPRTSVLAAGPWHQKMLMSDWFGLIPLFLCGILSKHPPAAGGSVDMKSSRDFLLQNSERCHSGNGRFGFKASNILWAHSRPVISRWVEELKVSVCSWRQLRNHPRLLLTGIRDLFCSSRLGSSDIFPCWKRLLCFIRLVIKPWSRSSDWGRSTKLSRKCLCLLVFCVNKFQTDQKHHGNKPSEPVGGAENPLVGYYSTTLCPLLTFGRLLLH